MNDIEISQPSLRSEVKLDVFQSTFIGRYNDLLYVFEKKASNLNEVVKIVEPYIEIEKAYFQNFDKFFTQNKNFANTAPKAVVSLGSTNTFDPAFDPKLSDSWDLFKHWLNVLYSGSEATLRNFKSVKSELEGLNTEFDHEKKKVFKKKNRLFYTHIIT